MFYKDLSFYQYYISSPIKNVLNVGWLDNENDFAVGELPPEFCQKLELVIIGNNHFDVHFNRIRGVHPCNLCGEREVAIVNGGREDLLGMTEILIPDVEKKLFFASPSMVAHYIKVHGYLPPQPFIDAVLQLDLTQNYCAEEVFDELLASRTE